MKGKGNMSNKSRKNKSSQSPKQKPITVAKDDPLNEIVKEAVEETKSAAPPDKQGPEKGKHDPNTSFSFETNLPEINKAINEIVIVLQAVADRLNKETIFGIPAARFQAYTDTIKKYPKQLKKKAEKERRRLTQTETKEEKKDKKAAALREKIQTLQTKLAKL